MAWLQLEDYVDSADFYRACAELHKDEQDPEFMMQDFEGFPRSLYSESGNLEAIYEYVDFCRDSYLDQDVIDAGLELDIPLESIEEAYVGSFENDEDFAYDMAEQCGAIEHDAKWPNNHIDWESAARDLMQDYNEQDGHYFSNHW